MRALRGFVAVGLSMLLFACAAPPPVVAPDAAAGAVEFFELSGRVAVKLDGRGHSARMRWRHQPESDALWLYSPVGSTIASLYADGEMATLVTAKKETFRSENVQALTREVLGWDLPLPGLKYWVLGRVDPDEPIEDAVFDEQQRLVRLAQGGWNIDFVGYHDTAPLPASMVLRFSDLRMRLLIDRWDLSATPQ